MLCVPILGGKFSSMFEHFEQQQGCGSKLHDVCNPAGFAKVTIVMSHDKLSASMQGYYFCMAVSSKKEIGFSSRKLQSNGMGSGPCFKGLDLGCYLEKLVQI